jgi:cytolethal distending toxin subunit B
MTVVVTWNMQGANWTDDMKWRTGVTNLFSNGADLALLQECGPLPVSANLVWVSPADPLLSLHTWGGTVTRGRYSLLFYHWDVLGGNRVNMAIVSRVAIVPANVRPVIWGALFQRRPAIGVTFGVRTYYTVHGRSGGGTDVPGLLVAINADAPGTAFVGGDFNRLPVSPLAGMFCMPPNGPTHSTRTNHPLNTLDYMFTNWAPHAGLVGTVQGLIASDHYPVEYDH